MINRKENREMRRRRRSSDYKKREQYEKEKKSRPRTLARQGGLDPGEPFRPQFPSHQLTGSRWVLAVLETSDGYIGYELMLFSSELLGCPACLMESHPEVQILIGTL